MVMMGFCSSIITLRVLQGTFLQERTPLTDYCSLFSNWRACMSVNANTLKAAKQYSQESVNMGRSARQCMEAENTAGINDSCRTSKCTATQLGI